MKSSQLDSVIIGTSSWGSRITKSQGLSLLDDYIRAGVSRIDTAPPYGLGFAEGFLGEYLGGRDLPEVDVTTKCGIARPPANKLRIRVMPAIYSLSRISPVASKLINLVRPRSQVSQPSNVLFTEWEESLLESIELLQGAASIRVCLHDIHVTVDNFDDLQAFAEKIKARFGVVSVGFSSNVADSYYFSHGFDFINIDYGMLLRTQDLTCSDVCVHSVMASASKSRAEPVGLALGIIERGYSVILNPFGKQGRRSFEKILEILA